MSGGTSSSGRIALRVQLRPGPGSRSALEADLRSFGIPTDEIQMIGRHEWLRVDVPNGDDHAQQIAEALGRNPNVENVQVITYVVEPR